MRNNLQEEFNFLLQRIVDASKQKRTFALRNAGSRFDAAFAQILAKLPKITKKLMTLSI